MKNYYLKRIDELRTEIGSDSRPTPVATVSRIAAGATYPALKKGAELGTKAKQALKLPFEGLKGDVKNLLQKKLDRLKRKKNDPSRIARLKAKGQENREKAAKEQEDREIAAKEQEDREIAAKEQEDREKNPNSPTGSGFLTRTRTRTTTTDHTTYAQIGYILAESLGLL